MKNLAKFLNVIDAINEWSGKALSVVGLILMSAVVCSVIMRYVFNNPPLWGLELNGWLLLVMGFVGGGYALLHQAHVRVDLVYSRWPLRVRAIVDLVTYLVLFSIVAVLVRYGGETALDSLKNRWVSCSSWAPPLWPSQILIPIGAVLIGLQGIAKWLRDWVVVTRGVEITSKVVSDE